MTCLVYIFLAIALLGTLTSTTFLLLTIVGVFRFRSESKTLRGTRFVDEKLPELRARRATVIVNVCGTTIDEYAEVSRILSDHDGVAAIELNISCPNVSGGVDFGTDPVMCERLVADCRRVTESPIIAKLTPNVTSIAAIARAAEAGGAGKNEF